MTDLEIVLLILLYLVSVFFAFMFGGALGTRTNEERKKEMICSKCGHKGIDRFEGESGDI